MSRKQSIFLSFFKLSNQDFQFTVYRRLCGKKDKKEDFPGLSQFRLPPGGSEYLSEEDYERFWVSFDRSHELTAFVCTPRTNPHLTCAYLYFLLEQICQRRLAEELYLLPDKDMVRQRRIEFVLSHHELGKQVVWMEPYFLKSKQLFGFLLDFRFRSCTESYTVEAQKLALSLDENGDTNTSYYADRYDQLRKFIDMFSEEVFVLSDNILIEAYRCTFDDELLRTKRYQFADGKSGSSQFLGVRNHGPAKDAGEKLNCHFIYEEGDKWLSHRLYYALEGKTFPSQFPGIDKMFRIRFGRDTVAGTSVEEFTVDNVDRVLKQIEEDIASRNVLPVFISPFDESDDDDRYYFIKHLCLQRNSPCQFVSTRLLSDKNKLKWATSNIALQIFAKMGGEPWLVTPRSQNCLIIGIGQAHSREYGPAQKYFAYSVLTESSGLYKEVRILGDDSNFNTYIVNFEKQLTEVIEQYYDSYERFVIHSTFRVRKKEVMVVEDVVRQIGSRSGSGKEFVVIKFNERNKFFAYASHGNSMTPLESSIVRLSYDEYLVWFEGLQLHNPNLKTQVRRPVHVEFLHASRRLDSSRKRDYLQDALNISGANWRGFNAKSMPISINYAYLIAKFFREFQRLGLEDIDFSALSPWFL